MCRRERQRQPYAAEAAAASEAGSAPDGGYARGDRVVRPGARGYRRARQRGRCRWPRRHRRSGDLVRPTQAVARCDHRGRLHAAGDRGHAPVRATAARGRPRERAGAGPRPPPGRHAGGVGSRSGGRVRRRGRDRAAVGAVGSARAAHRRRRAGARRGRRRARDHGRDAGRARSPACRDHESLSRRADRLDAAALRLRRARHDRGARARDDRDVLVLLAHRAGDAGPHDVRIDGGWRLARVRGRWHPARRVRQGVAQARALRADPAAARERVPRRRGSRVLRAPWHLLQGHRARAVGEPHGR